MPGNINISMFLIIWGRLVPPLPLVVFVIFVRTIWIPQKEGLSKSGKISNVDEKWWTLMNSECCCNGNQIWVWCHAEDRWGGDARARVVFKIQPFVGSIPYHRLCHASAVYSLLVFVVDRQNKDSPIARWLWVRASCATIIGSVRSSLDPIPVSQYLPQITITWSVQ